MHCSGSYPSHSRLTYNYLVLDFANLCVTIVDKLLCLLKLLDNTQPCCGNSDERFLSLSNIHKGVMLDKSSYCI